MESILFACDLDGTLIHSHRCRQEGDICVEWLEGRELCFMDPEAHRLLRQVVKELLFVPVTTRSVEQYRRIRWPEGCEPEMAAVANGAVLLRRGAVVEAWRKKSLEAVRWFQEELERLYGLLSGRFQVCRIVDGMYLFASCRDEEEAARCAREYQGKTPLTVSPSGRKVYFFPPEINKGAAVRRLRELLEAKLLLCAGDSGIDLPMLDAAGVAVVPDGTLGKQVRAGETVVCPPGERFAGFVLETAIHRAVLIKKTAGPV